MKVILFGATGMVGQGVLRECLADREVTAAISVVRQLSGVSDPKLRELVLADFLDYTAIAPEFAGADACFYCLGASAAGLDETGYTRINYDYPLAAAGTLAKLNPRMTFIYVSGGGTDSTERGRVMWARVKGRTENALLRLFGGAYMLRPGFIDATHGEISKTRLYRAVYRGLRPFLPLLRRIYGRNIVTTVELGRIMLHLAKHGAAQHILEIPDLRALADELSSPAK